MKIFCQNDKMCECINHLNSKLFLKYVNKYMNCILKSFNKAFICIEYIFCYFDFIFQYRLHIFSSRNKILITLYFYKYIKF